jgi:hypothetical protein
MNAASLDQTLTKSSTRTGGTLKRVDEHDRAVVVDALQLLHPGRVLVQLDQSDDSCCVSCS